MSQFIINRDGSVEQDKIFICDRLLNRQGELYPAAELHTVMRLNQNDEVNFKIYKYNNGEENPFWDKIDNIQVILVEGKGYFEIAAPLTVEECAYKQVTGISLGEAETSQTYITLGINTDDDFAIQVREDKDKDKDKDVIPTILYNPNATMDNPEGSLLHRVFRAMPHYTIGHVDASVACIQRTFSCDNQTIYDFLQTVAKELECIFIFDNFKREVNCYDLKDHCNRQSCITANDYRNVKDGVCQHCQSSDYITYGYGKDSGVFIDNQNLAESVTLTGDKDSVKNCFKIEGADDTITNLLGDRLMDGNYLWMFSEYQKSQMSSALQRALAGHNQLVRSYQDEYNRLWDSYNECVDKLLYYQSGMMPDMKTDKTTARTVHNELFGAGGKIKYACKSSKEQTAGSVLSSIKTFAKQIIPDTYEIDLSLVSSSTANIVFSSHIFLKEAYKDESAAQNDEYTSSVSLSVKDGWNIYYTSAKNPVFTTDYFLYLKQQLEMSLEKSNVSDKVVSFNPPVSGNSNSVNPIQYAQYDNESNPQNLPPIHYTMYCYNRLKSFRDAYESCSQIVAKHSEQIASDNQNILQYISAGGSQSGIYNDLLKKYYDYICCLDARMAYLESKINSLDSLKDSYKTKIDKIKSTCNMKNFLVNFDGGSYGDSLWVELCSFKREDTYRNENYAGEGIKNEEIIKNVDGLIRRAREELEQACEISYSINTAIGNLLTMKEFEPLWDDFTLGNWIRIKVDKDIYKLRLISITFNYSDLAQISVEFSDATKSNSQMADLKSLFQQASSMATNFNSVTRQAEKGYLTNQEFAIMKEAGLDIANTMITNADNQDFVIDRYGLTGRIWNDAKNAFDDEQIRIINNLLCFTSDGWRHTRLALGKIYYYADIDETGQGQWKWDYGLNAEVLISRLILSEMLKIYNKSGTYSITDKGFFIDYKNNTIEINAMEPSLTISKKENGIKHIYMRYSPADGLIIDGTGKFSGMVLVGKETGTHIKLDPEKPSMVIYDGKENIFDFNSDGSGILTITAGIITSILKSKDYKKGLSGMCIDLQNKSLEIYDKDGKELLSYNLDKNEVFRVAGWKIDKDRIYSDKNNSYINLYSGGNIESYTDKGEKYCAKLENGTYRFSTYGNPDEGWIELSNNGLWAVSRKGYAVDNQGSQPLFRVDTNEDIVKIISNSNKPGLHIQNKGTGDSLFCQNTVTGQENKALHCEVYTGDNQKKFLSVFGERNLNRIVFRADVGDDTGPNDPNPKTCLDSALGTAKYPWGEIHSQNGTVSTSDLKKKDIIEYISTTEALEFISKLKPIKYTFKDSKHKRIHMGFGAQHVAETAKELNMGNLSLYEAAYSGGEDSESYYQEGADDSKLSWGLKYDEFEAPMVASIQALHEMTAAQEQILHEKDKEIKQLKEQVNNLSDKYKKLEEILQKHGLS